MEGVVQQVAIQIAILVIIKKGGVGREPQVCNAIGLRLLCKGEIAIIYKECVVPVGSIRNARFTNINIGPAIAVNIGNTHPGRPDPLTRYPCLFRDIFKDKIALVDIKLIIYNVAAKIDIGQTIIVKISKSDTCSIVEIPVSIGIVLFSIFNLVNK